MPDTVPRCLFTFHNVSINSPERINESFGGYGFTFHNVSINSPERINESFGGYGFTFHNVSINSIKND